MGVSQCSPNPTTGQQIPGAPTKPWGVTQVSPSSQKGPYLRLGLHSLPTPTASAEQRHNNTVMAKINIVVDGKYE